MWRKEGHHFQLKCVLAIHLQDSSVGGLKMQVFVTKTNKIHHTNCHLQTNYAFPWVKCTSLQYFLNYVYPIGLNIDWFDNGCTLWQIFVLCFWKKSLMQIKLNVFFGKNNNKKRYKSNIVKYNFNLKYNLNLIYSYDGKAEFSAVIIPSLSLHWWKNINFI